MLSKQDKLKYGQMLRLQMKQKEQKKRMQQLQKRGIKKSPTDGHLLVQKQNNTLAEQKQFLQKRLQTEDYMPFGRPGAGAPTKVQGGNIYQINRQKTENYNSNHNVQIPLYAQPQQQRRQQPQNYNNANYNETHGQNIQNYQNPHNPYGQYETEQNYQHNYQNQHQYSQPQHTMNSYQPVHQIPPPQYDLNAKYQPSQYYNQQRQQPQYSNNYNSQQQNQYYSQSPQSYPVQQAGSRFEQNPPNYQQQRQWDNFNSSKPPVDLYQKPMDQIIRNEETNRQRTMQNQQAMEMYRKGGRNLLKLQNQTAQELTVKQKQKIEMQKYLKLQIEQAERKKRQQKQRIKQQELQQQKQNREYLERQNQKIKEEEQKQVQKKRRIQQENENNLKIKRQMQQDIKRAAQAKQNRFVNSSTNNPPPQQFHQQPQVFTKQVNRKNIIEEQSQSVSSNSIMIQQAFNTDVSKEFFRRERQRDPQKSKQDKKIQVFTDQLQKMRNQINNQGVVFQKQINRVKMEADRALQEKRRADREIQKLKEQLKKKMEDDNQRLFEALNRNAKTNNYDSPPLQYKKKVNSQKRHQQIYRGKPPLRPKKQQKLVDRIYQTPEQLQQLEQTNQFDGGMRSLVGDSKKIPLNLKTNKDLSMSQLSQFARQTGFFKQKNESPKKSYSKNIKQSIVQQDQQRFGSRSGSRVTQKQNNYHKNNKYNYGQEQRDQLDKLVDSRQKSRGGWGQLSSVNSDITKQIEDLLKKKGNPTHQRPRSRKLQSAGKQSLSNYNHGIAYEGGTINTLNSGGTFDIDRIQGRNEDRLRQLKNLGVETINTNDDGDLNRLDILLNKYAY